MIIKHKFSVICITFTLITLFADVLALSQGTATDTHAHLIIRFIVCTIGVGSMVIFEWMKDKSQYLALAVHYFSALGLVLLFAFSSQIFEPLSKGAYRDVTISFTSAYIAFAIVCTIIEKKKKKVSTNM